MAVLGIDAAWTTRNPSGVALVELKGSRVRAVAAAPSYEAFVRGHTDWQSPQPGGVCDAGALLDAASRLTPLPVRCVAVDMALSRAAITGRRAADDRVSSAFGAAWCGTHSPNMDRPGEVSSSLVRQFERRGFTLATRAPRPPGGSLIEVHPHAALLRLMGEEKRLPYKISRLRQYYPGANAQDRRARLLRTWRRIVRALENVSDGAATLLPSNLEFFRMSRLKAVEDTLDALICAWVGVEFLRGRAEGYGDDDAAIWIPMERTEATGVDPSRARDPSSLRSSG